MGIGYGDRRVELAWSNEPDPTRLLAGAMTMVGDWITDSWRRSAGGRAGTPRCRAALQDLRDLHDRGRCSPSRRCPTRSTRWSGLPPTAQPSPAPHVVPGVGRRRGRRLMAKSCGWPRRHATRHSQAWSGPRRADRRAGPRGWRHLDQSGGGHRVFSLPGCSQPLIAVKLYRKCWEISPDSQPATRPDTCWAAGDRPCLCHHRGNQPAQRQQRVPGPRARLRPG